MNRKFVGTFVECAAVTLSALALVQRASAANYWTGVDGADLSVAENWSSKALPTGYPGYFNGRSEHGADYRVSLSQDVSLFQLCVGGNAPKAGDVVLDLGGHVLTLTSPSTDNARAPIRVENDGATLTVTNGTLGASAGLWVLGSDQEFVLGEKAVVNASSVIKAAGTNPSTGTKIIVKDGAVVTGTLGVGSYQSEAEILVTGPGTTVNFNSAQFYLATGGSTATNNTFRVEDGAVVTNMTLIDIANNASESGLRLCVDSGAQFMGQNWDKVGGAETRLGKTDGPGGNEIFVGDGATYASRVVTVYGSGNTMSVSNGTLKAVKFTIPGGNRLCFAGTSPSLYQTGQNGLALGENCTLEYVVPAEGYTTSPADLYPGGDFTMPDSTQLSVDADAYSKAGGGTVTLMSFRGSRAITFSDTLLSRWNEELAAMPKYSASVAYDSENRTLKLTVSPPRGLVIIIH